MNKLKAIETVEKAIQMSEELFKLNSEWEPIVSTRIQLKYILTALKNKGERTKLKDLTIGVYAVREFETEYEDFANLIYEVVEISTLMKKGKL
ncbi:immunity protein Tsi6 family protein [Zobellia galactanivorans]|uniref:immunity protein Tsi6 family protein n=1 Tax=Zobellia galactanivorans (strain DSM 12802 / CCUG 47099 / CIP 106680 / NCIMB 13871 / Dsij) TaxID=63186 RepID=UPI0026E28EDE|nr:immunity protein Tsi6 family protein [Zobellia galactanivorans]MDO6811254.1 immunity protein Tsi6 family protein [Zobellia galactanivorans]